MINQQNLLKLGLVLAKACGVYLVLCLGVMLIYRQFIYAPELPWSTPPEKLGLPQATEIRLRPSDGESLVAWEIQPRDAAVSGQSNATRSKPKLIYLYLPGGNGTLATRINRFKAFTQDGDGLIAVSWRSLFGSSGSGSEAGLKRDAEAAYSKALAMADGDPRRLIIVGEDLGSALAIFLASQPPADARGIAAGLILDTPALSIDALAQDVFWMFPMRWIMADHYRSDIAIRNVHMPLLIVHARGDAIVPYRHATTLFALAPGLAPGLASSAPGSGGKQLLTVDQSTHPAMNTDAILQQAIDWAKAVEK